jgi:hypothetical protein
LIEDSPVLPNFLVIGAGKGGTTSLHRWLGAHPQVFVATIKETNYFAYVAQRTATGALDGPVRSQIFPVRAWENYQALFRDAEKFAARGEVSPMYLALPGVPEKIADRLPDARLVVILRHPVDRAYSSYLMHSRDGREHRSFAQAVREELDGTCDAQLAYGQRNYLQIGYYHHHLSRYWQHFDPQRCHVELYDDLVADPHALLRRVYRFIGVDTGFEPDMSTRMNPSGIPRSRIIAPLLKKNRVSRVVRALLPGRLHQNVEQIFDRWRAAQLVKPPLDAALRASLTAKYQDDIHRLAETLGRDLSDWLYD